MVIKRAQDPVKLSAGHFYDINIEKFDKVREIRSNARKKKPWYL